MENEQNLPNFTYRSVRSPHQAWQRLLRQPQHCVSSPRLMRYKPSTLTVQVFNPTRPQEAHHHREREENKNSRPRRRKANQKPLISTEWRPLSQWWRGGRVMIGSHGINRVVILRWLERSFKIGGVVGRPPPHRAGGYRTEAGGGGRLSGPGNASHRRKYPKKERETEWARERKAREIGRD